VGHIQEVMAFSQKYRIKLIIIKKLL